ncbi:MAG: glycosyltransferase family 4 protein [Marinicella sp.]
MAHILFVDTSHPKAYDFDDLAAQAMGGTESSLLRTAKILCRHGQQVTVFQQQRVKPIEQNEIQFVGPQQLNEIQTPEHVVVLRKFPQLINFKLHYPQAQFHLWIHTYKNWEYVFKRSIRFKPAWQLITNSHTHAKHCDKLLNRGMVGRIYNLFKSPVSIKTCYNPIPAQLTEYPPQKRDLNKLLFLSAPNKGLDQVLNTFQQINRHLKDLKLYVANPGYREDQPEDITNVHYLGALPAEQVKQHLASSLCVFYPQDSFAETFGLIYAEANALGTPVMAHDIGAAREILHPNNALINAEDNYQITKTLVEWQRQLPAVSYRQEFNEPAIMQQWVEALGL